MKGFVLIYTIATVARLPYACCIMSCVLFARKSSKKQYFNILQLTLFTLLPGSKFTKCSSILNYRVILIFGTSEGIENCFEKSKVKIKCSTKKGNNLRSELLKFQSSRFYCWRHQDSTIIYEVQMRDKNIFCKDTFPMII